VTPRVTIVAQNGTTLDELQRYLSSSGIAASAIGDADPAQVDAQSSVVVFFPDDFEPSAARGFVTALRQSRPAVLFVLVTREPQHLSSVVGPYGRSAPPVLLPRPSFGWSIVDAIRAHTPSEPPSRS
jgi:hypothetical protein